MKIKEIIKVIYKNPSLPSLLMLLLLIIVNTILQPNFFTYRSFKSNFLTFTPLVLVSIAQAIVILVGAVDLSIGSTISLITVVMASIMGDTPGSILVALMCAFGVALLTGLFNGFIISYLAVPPLIMTYATWIIWFGIALLIMPTPGGYITKAFYKAYRADILHILPAPFLLLIIALLVCFFISKLRIYKYIYAVGGNDQAAYASGINVLFTKLKAFLLSEFFVALSAICVVAQTATGDARSGLGYILNSVAAAIIGGISFSGGKGNVAGAAMGGLILGLLINIIFDNITSFYQEFMKGVIIIVSLAIGVIPKLRGETSLP
jgi:ribose transport system permease protein